MMAILKVNRDKTLSFVIIDSKWKNKRLVVVVAWLDIPKEDDPTDVLNLCSQRSGNCEVQHWGPVRPGPPHQRLDDDPTAVDRFLPFSPIVAVIWRPVDSVQQQREGAASSSGAWRGHSAECRIEPGIIHQSQWYQWSIRRRRHSCGHPSWPQRLFIRWRSQVCRNSFFSFPTLPCVTLHCYSSVDVLLSSIDNFATAWSKMSDEEDSVIATLQGLGTSTFLALLERTNLMETLTNDGTININSELYNAVLM